MKLNCDMGENYGNWNLGSDEAVMPYVDMANIACGFHASDPLTMDRTVKLAKQYQVTIGAHPGYPDLVGFGRRAMAIENTELRSIIQYQVGALAAICRANQIELSYVKPHGALYHAMMQQPETMATIMDAVKEMELNLALMIQADSQYQTHQAQADARQLPLIFEAFADRCYQDTGALLSRDQDGAQLDEQQMLKQAHRLMNKQQVITHSQQILAIKAETLCVHGDNPAAINGIAKLAALLRPPL
ncbi:5-oxoprolinase subunit PxpA [Motilimonas cestriensis]|uniref:5-oxoprolinase subunit PxpA n=1 Tax=Motilimonas cestriensis TaxID=2742685 RepID=UPI003DA6B6EC